MQENKNPSQSEPVSSDDAIGVTKSSGEKVSRKSQRKISRSTKNEVLAARRKTNPMVWLLLLVNTLVVIALCGASFYAWTQWQSMQSSQAEREAVLVQEVNTSVAAQLSDVNASALAGISALENKLTGQIASSGAKLDELTGQISSLQNTSTTNWDAAELNYLLKMAQRKVNIESDVKTALEILSEADAILFEKNDDSFLPVREAIAADIQNLKAARVNSPVEAAISVTGLMQLSGKLVFPEPETYYENNVYNMTDDPQDAWQNLKTVWRKMVDDFLTIEKLDEDIEPYLGEQQKQLVRGALQQSLLTIRYALLKQEPSLFSAAVNETESLLKQFDQRQAEVVVFSQELNKIASAPFPLKSRVVLTSTSIFSELSGASSPSPISKTATEEQSL